jgi:hypothetical protein
VNGAAGMRSKSSLAFLGLLAGPAPAAAGDWSGVYIGIGVGAGAANHELSLDYRFNFGGSETAPLK